MSDKYKDSPFTMEHQGSWSPKPSMHLRVHTVSTTLAVILMVCMIFMNLTNGSIGCQSFLTVVIDWCLGIG